MEPEHRQRSASSASSRSSSRKRDRSASPTNASSESSKTFKKPHSKLHGKTSDKLLPKKTKLAEPRIDQSANDKTKTNMASQEGQGEKLSAFETQVLEQLKNLELKMDNIDSKIDKRMSVLESRVFDLEQSQDQCKNDVENLKKHQGLSEELLLQNETVAKLSQEKAFSNEQYQRNFNLRIFNVEESEQETITECENKVLKLFEEKLQVVVPIEAIDIIHRLGPKPKKTNGGQSVDANLNTSSPSKNNTNQNQLDETHGANAMPGQNKDNENQNKSDQNKPKSYVGRPIIVSFLSRRIRREILANRSRLKKKTKDELPIIVAEDLTKQNHALFEKARYANKFSAVWTKDGIVHGKQENGLVVIIKSCADIDSPPIERQYTPAGYSRGNRRHRGRGGRGRGSGPSHAHIPTLEEKIALRNRFEKFQYQSAPDSEMTSQGSKEDVTVFD